jgi:pimeloyl-ACP methyl ester carboxylesterase
VVLDSLGLTVLLSLLVGMVYEAIGSAADARRMPRIGTRYNIGGGVKLNLFCSGAAGPTVIFESGLGSPGYSWYKVQPEVAKFSRACWYDRAGYGWSDPANTPRTSEQIARELHALLGASGIAPPYVLVAHSFGGYNARMFHSFYPLEVAGIVLVDSSHEDQMSRMPETLRRQWDRERENYRAIPFLINIGLVRLMRLVERFPVAPPSVTGPDRAILEYLMFQPKLFRAAFEEMGYFGNKSAAQVRGSGDLGNLPLELLVATRPEPGDDAAYVRVWNEELQPALAKLSTRSHLTRLDCGHMIPYDRPDAVIAATRSVVETARTDRLLCRRATLPEEPPRHLR